MKMKTHIQATVDIKKQFNNSIKGDNQIKFTIKTVSKLISNIPKEHLHGSCLMAIEYT